MAISTAPRPSGQDIEIHPVEPAPAPVPGRPWVDGSTALLVDHVTKRFSLGRKKMAVKRLINRVSVDVAFRQHPEEMS